MTPTTAPAAQATKIPTTASDSQTLQVQVTPPTDGEQPPPPTTLATTTLTTATDVTPSLSRGGTSDRGGGISASAVTQGENLVRPSGDVGDLLGKSQSATGVEVQRRSPIITDPRIRGYQVGQIVTQADGAYWIPARRDLDTVVSKIDADRIRDAVVIKGPYSVRYGPGFAFIDVETLGAQRFEKGWEVHGSTSLIYKTNGQQWRGRQNFWGGDEDFGFRIGYDLATGKNYETGADVTMPSAYNSQNIDFAVAYWLSPDSHIEIKGLRVDQENVELAGQVFDINRLIADAFTGRYILENQEFFDKMFVEAWWNETRLNGDNLRPSKRAQIPQLNATFIDDSGMPQRGLGFNGFTDADSLSTGFRQATTWGKGKCPQVTLGVDLRYLSQRLNEFDIATGFASGLYGIPRSHSVDPGLFFDAVIPIGPTFQVRAGTRFDWVSTNIDRFPTTVPGNTGFFFTFPGIPVPPNLPATAHPVSKFDEEFNLWSGYVGGEYKVTQHVTAIGQFAIAQRPPTLTELYAIAPLVSVLQNGLNAVVGNPNLSPEQARQLDFGLRAEFERFRGGVNGFYAWIHNCITFENLGLNLPPIVSNGISVQFVNTELATLAGGEAYAEYDVIDWLTPFASLTYVEGRDHTRDKRGFPLPGIFPADQEPLPGIPPLEARLGVRVHEGRKNPRWGVEVSARVVDEQDRFAESLAEVGTPGFTVWDLRSYWQATRTLLLTAGVENFGNKNYQEHLDLRTGTGALGHFGVFQPGVNFYFGARLEY